MKGNKLIMISLILVTIISIASPIITCKGESEEFKLLSAYWGDTSQVEVTGGDYATLTIILRYEGKWSFNNLVAKLSLPEPFKTSDKSNMATIYYKSTVTPGSIIQLAYQIYISPQALKGTYLSNLNLEYFISNYGLISQTIQIPLEITGRPNIQLSLYNETLIEGRQTALLTIKNLGDADAYNLQISRAYSSSITINNVGDTYIEHIKPGENATSTIEIYVPSGLKGKTVQINFDIRYIGPRNSIYTETKSIQALINPQDPQPKVDVKLSTGELYIGKINKLNITISNNGYSAIRNVKMSISTDATIKVFGSSTMYIDDLEPWQNSSIPIDVYVPLTTAATGTITISTTYYDTARDVSVSDTWQITMLLRGFIELTLTDVAIIPASPRPNTPFSITITITNVGTSTAYAIYATPILENLPIQPFGSRSVYIGNIDVNTPTTFTINLQLLNTTLTQVKLPVVLRYMDNLRNISEKTFEITINISPTTSTTTTTTQSRGTFISILTSPLTIISIIAIIVIVSGVLIMRRRRK
jgi:hypothetical protein